MFELVQNDPCPYLPGLEAHTRYRVVEACRAEDYERWLERGWRRFGHTFFRPECADCVACRSLRVDVGSFTANRSQRRNLQRNQDLEWRLRPATWTPEHLDLYMRYHRDMERRRDWPDRSIGPLQYAQTFVEGRHTWGHELLFFDGGQLVCVALVDILPTALSAVYCYYDPDARSRGLGVFSVLSQIELARRRQIGRVYLGYWIRRNASMRYKAGYRPHELLLGRPDDEALPDWRSPEAYPGLG